MPVPWKVKKGDSGRPFVDDNYCPSITPDVGQRAMTLRQLYQLRDYLKRLCKVGVLKESSGKRIFWFDLNQYHINELVIKRIIPENQSCSWMEFVSEGPQLPDTFISHYWGESFRDFMLSIEHHAIDLRVGLDHTYWFCVCADNQWKLDEELGSPLQMSPFYNALENAQETLLMLDRDGLVMQRAWCLFEWHRTIKIRPESLRVATCMGLVGSALVSSGPYIDLLKGLYSASAKASDPRDLRRIQNTIAGCNEFDDLEMIVRIKSVTKSRIFTESSHCFVNGDVVVFQVGVGNPLHTKGIPLNDGTELYVKVTSKTELELFKTRHCTVALYFEGGQRTNLIKMDYAAKHLSWMNIHKPAFHELDSQVKNGALGQTRDYFKSIHTQGSMSFLKYRAITLAQLRNFAQDIKRRCIWEKWSHEKLEKQVALHDKEKPDKYVPGDSARSKVKSEGELTWEEVTWYHIKYFVIMKATAERGCSYVETITGTPRQGQYHFTFPWNMTLAEFMASIEWLAEARQMPDTTPLLVYPLTFNLRTNEYYDGEVWKDNMNACESAVYAGNILRMGPLLDLQNSIAGKQSVDFMCSTGVKAFVRPFVGGSWEFGRFDIDIAHQFVNFDVDNVESHHPRLRKNFLSLGKDAHDSLTKILRVAGAGPILREAAYLNDSYNTLSEVVLQKCYPWLNINNPRVKGPLGETPLHVAASAGNIRMIEILLKLKADINAMDFDGETPLHYAALAGQSKSVQLLLDENADASLLSYFSETPLDVAEQHPAFFLVDYDDVKTILSGDNYQKNKTVKSVPSRL